MSDMSARRIAEIDASCGDVNLRLLFAAADAKLRLEDARGRKIIEIVKSGGYTVDQIAKGLEFIGAALRRRRTQLAINPRIGS